AGDVATTPWYVDSAMTTLGSSATADDPVVVVPAGGGIAVTIAPGIENPRVDVSELMVGGGAFEVGDGLTVSHEDARSVWFPAGTTVTPSGPWDGELIVLEAVSLTNVTIPGGSTAKVITAIKLGSDT